MNISKIKGKWSIFAIIIIIFLMIYTIPLDVICRICYVVGIILFWGLLFFFMSKSKFLIYFVKAIFVLSIFFILKNSLIIKNTNDHDNFITEEIARQLENGQKEKIVNLINSTTTSTQHLQFSYEFIKDLAGENHPYIHSIKNQRIIIFSTIALSAILAIIALILLKLKNYTKIFQYSLAFLTAITMLYCFLLHLQITLDNNVHNQYTKSFLIMTKDYIEKETDISPFLDILKNKDYDFYEKRRLINVYFKNIL